MEEIFKSLTHQREEFKRFILSQQNDRGMSRVYSAKLIENQNYDEHTAD